MTTLTSALPPSSTRPHAPAWFWAAAALGVAWNAYGLFQFALGFTDAGRAALAAGMTPQQAAVYFALPAWITAVFAVGVFGGLLGSLALLARRAVARPVLTASLAGYALLFAGDFHYGVFDALPAQLAILLFVVAVAAGLRVVAGVASRRGLLR